MTQYINVTSVREVFFLMIISDRKNSKEIWWFRADIIIWNNFSLIGPSVQLDPRIQGLGIFLFAVYRNKIEIIKYLDFKYPYLKNATYLQDEIYITISVLATQISGEETVKCLIEELHVDLFRPEMKLSSLWNCFHWAASEHRYALMRYFDSKVGLNPLQA